MMERCGHCRKLTKFVISERGTECPLCGYRDKIVDDLQAYAGGINDDNVTAVYVGYDSTPNYKENKIYHAQKLIQNLMDKLGFSAKKSEEVEALIKKVTDGEYGQGEWFPVLVGACSYIVRRRKDQIVLPIAEVADEIGCDMYELGRMVSRVLDFVDEKLPEFDIVNAFERTIKQKFHTVSKDLVQRMLEQGVFLVQCLIKWFVTTGRRPMPVVVAVLVFVAELNEIDVKIEDVAEELRLAKSTCRRRYMELLEKLVEVAQVLPWGKDVTVKNILKNAPSVMQYMEIKSCSLKKQRIEDFKCDVEGLVGECLRKEIGYECNAYNSMKDCSSKYFELDNLPSLASDYPDKFQISPESLKLIYSNYMEELRLVQASAESDETNRRKRLKRMDLQCYLDWWSGKSDMSKKLILKQILEKDIGLDSRPPSFDKACLLKGRRREKIKAAKLRISRIMHPRIGGLVPSNDACVHEPEKSRKKRKKMSEEINWEDLIIETLILHNVKEEEIEKGYYNTLLDLHVFCHTIDE